MNLASRELPFEHELVVDLFAGGGGASLGMARAYREPDPEKFVLVAKDGPEPSET